MAWDPSDLSPTAWYDVDLGGSATQITDSSGNSRAALTFAGGSNSPTWIDYATTGPMVRLAGSTASRIATTATTTLFDGATALDLRYAVTFPDWSPSAPLLIGTKGSAGGGVTAYVFEVSLMSTKAIRLSMSNGTATTTATSTGTGSTVSFSDGAIGAVRVTWDGTTAKFYEKTVSAATAYADIADDAGWTKLGDDVAASLTLYSTSQQLAIGSRPSGSANAPDGFACHAFWGATTIDGDPVVAFDAAKTDHTGYTDSVSSLAWTIARPTTQRKTVVVSPAANATKDTLLTGADDYADGPTAAVPAATSSDSCTLAAVIRPFATMAAGNVILTTRASATAAGVRLEMAGTASVRAVVSDGTTDVTTAAVNLTLGQRNLVGVILDSSGTARAFVANGSGTTLGTTSSRPSGSQTGGDLRTGHDQALSTGSDLDAESECPYVAYPTAVSSSDLQRIFDYYDNDARAESSAATAEAYQPASNVSSGPGTAAATADAQQAGTGVTAPAEVAATVTAAAYDATGNVSVYPDTASVTASANGVGSNATTTTTTATVTAAANAAGSGVAASAEVATVTATAHAAGSSATTVVQLVAAVVAAALNASGDSVKQQALRATFIERTRATFRETRSP